IAWGCARVPSPGQRVLPCHNRTQRQRCRANHQRAAPVSIPFLCTAGNFRGPCVGARFCSLRKKSCSSGGRSFSSDIKLADQRALAPEETSWAFSNLFSLACQSIRVSALGGKPQPLGKLWKGRSAFSNGNPHNARRSPHDRVALRPLFHLRRHARELLLHDLRKFSHLLLHDDHFFAHVQDDLDSREGHAHVTCQCQDYVQALQVGVRIQPRVALRARRLQQPPALIQPQRLPIHLLKLRHRANHVAGFSPFFGSWRHHTPALLNKSFRGSSGSIFSSSFIKLRTRSSVRLGTTTWPSTY